MSLEQEHVRVSIVGSSSCRKTYTAMHVAEQLTQEQVPAAMVSRGDLFRLSAEVLSIRDISPDDGDAVKVHLEEIESHLRATKQDSRIVFSLDGVVFTQNHVNGQIASLYAKQDCMQRWVDSVELKLPALAPDTAVYISEGRKPSGIVILIDIPCPIARSLIRKKENEEVRNTSIPLLWQDIEEKDKRDEHMIAALERVETDLIHIRRTWVPQHDEWTIGLIKDIILGVTRHTIPEHFYPVRVQLRDIKPEVHPSDFRPVYRI